MPLSLCSYSSKNFVHRLGWRRENVGLTDCMIRWVMMVVGCCRLCSWSDVYKVSEVVTRKRPSRYDVLHHGISGCKFAVHSNLHVACGARMMLGLRLEAGRCGTCCFEFADLYLQQSTSRPENWLYWRGWKLDFRNELLYLLSHLKGKALPSVKTSDGHIIVAFPREKVSKTLQLSRLVVIQVIDGVAILSDQN